MVTCVLCSALAEVDSLKNFRCFDDAGNHQLLITDFCSRAQLLCCSVGRKTRSLWKWADWHLRITLVSYVAASV